MCRVFLLFYWLLFLLRHPCEGRDPATYYKFMAKKLGPCLRRGDDRAALNTQFAKPKLSPKNRFTYRIINM